MSEVWGRVHSQSYVFESGCWHTCSGFSCANNHRDFDFVVLPMLSGTTLLYAGPEYKWLANQQSVLRDAQGREAAKAITFAFGGPVPLTVYHTTCGLLGACAGKIEKPLLCKVYPFFPVLNLDGELEELYPASIFELTFPFVGTPTPCTVASHRERYLDQWKKNRKALEPLRHPAVVFYLRAAKHFMDNYLSGLHKSTNLKSLRGKEFWAAWEVAYLSGQLLAVEDLKSQILHDYNQLRKKYGAFEI